MPDTLSTLYQQNKKAQTENALLEERARRLMQPNQVDVPEWTPDYSRVMPDLSGKLSGAYDDAGRYTSYIESPSRVSLGDSDINYIRARNQPFGQQLGNALLRAVPNIALGTIYNIAATLDFEDYFNADDEVGNAVSDLMNEWQEGIRKWRPVYRERPGESFDIGDSGWWVDNGSMLLESAGAFVASGAITGAALTRTLGLLGSQAISAIGKAKIATKTEAALAEMQATGAAITPEIMASVQAAQKAKYVNGVLSYPATVLTAVANNQAESIMEASQVYNDVMNKKLQDGKTVEEAKQAAADAASLNVNINRMNIAFNLTSAGLFTKGAQAIKSTYGGKIGTVLGESAQEAVEEGVNYIAQKEAMLQSEEGYAYQFDADRAIGHLADEQGLEAMFLGALGGGVQTALTEMIEGNDEIESAKKRAKEASSAVSNAQKAANPQGVDSQQVTHTQAKIMSQWLNERSNAKTPEDVIIAEDKYINSSAENLVRHKDSSLIDTRIAALEHFISTTGDNSIEDVDSKRVADKELKHLYNVKTISDGEGFWSYNNRDQIVKTNLEMIRVNKELSNVAKQADLIRNSSTPRTPENDRILDLEAKLAKEYSVLARDLEHLKSPEIQGIKKSERAEAAARQSAEESSAISTSNKSTTSTHKPVNKPPKATTSSPASSATSEVDANTGLTISYGEPAANATVKKYITEEGVLGGGSPVMSKEDESAVFGDSGADFVVRSFKDNGVERSYVGTKEDGGMSIQPMAITSSGKPARISAFRSIVSDAKASGRNAIIDFEGKIFNVSDLDSWMQSNGIDGDLTKEDVASFLSTIQEAESTVDEAPQSRESDREISPSKDKDEFDKNRISRSEPFAVNYSAEMAIFNLEGRARGTGVINEGYLDNSDPSITRPGISVSLEVFDGNVNMYNYDSNGRVILNDGVKSASATTASEINKANLTPGSRRRSLPIAIYEINGDGSRGRIIGFMPDNEWLDERDSDGRRINIKFNPNIESADDVELKIEFVKDIRRNLEAAYEASKPTFVKTEISNVSEGKLLYSDVAKSVSENMPDIIKDLPMSGHPISPFAYVSAGEIIGSDGRVVDGIANSEYIGKSHNGLPVVIVPSANGGLIATKAASKTLSNTPWGISAIIGGLRAFASGGSGISSYNKAVSNDRAIKAKDSLREYLKQFIFFDSHANIGNYPSGAKYQYIYTETDQSGNKVDYFVFGTKGSKNNRIEISRNGGPSGEISDASIEALRTHLSDIKHSYALQSGKTGGKASVIVAISEDGKSANVIAKSRDELNSKTLNTFAKVAGKSSSGRNIYAIQPNIELVYTELNESGNVGEAQQTSMSESEVKTKKADVEMGRQESLSKPEEKKQRRSIPTIPKREGLADDLMAAEGIYTSGVTRDNSAEVELSPLSNTDISDVKSASEIITKFCKG